MRWRCLSAKRSELMITRNRSGCWDGFRMMPRRMPLCLCIDSRPCFIHDFDVIVQDGRDDRHHICFHHSCPHILRTSYANVDHALKSKAPLPHLHQIPTPTLLEDAHETFNAAIDGENVPNAGG